MKEAGGGSADSSGRLHGGRQRRTEVLHLRKNNLSYAQRHKGLLGPACCTGAGGTASRADGSNGPAGALGRGSQQRQCPSRAGHEMGVRVQGWTQVLSRLCEPRLGGEGAGGEKVLKMSKVEATAESTLPQAERPLQRT